MAVAVDATGTALVGGSSVTTINYTGITVGAALSNSALVVTFAGGVTNAITGLTATWDAGGTNQAMTLIGSKSCTTASIGTVAVFGLRAPTAGNKTLTVSWTGSAFPVIEAISFTGVDQTSTASAFKNFNSNSAASGNGSVVITSAVGDIAVAIIGSQGTVSTPNQTQLYLDLTSGGLDSAAQRANGAASVSFTLASSSGQWAAAGFDLGAAGAAVAVTLGKTPSRVFQPTQGPTKGLRPTQAYPAGASIFNDSVTEAGSATDTDSATAVFAASDTEAGSATETETAAVVFASSITEAGTATDAEAATAIFAASDTEAGSATESESASAVFAASETEAATATDTVDAAGTFGVSVSEAATATEVESGGILFAASVTEAGSASDAETVAATFAATASEAGTATDTSSTAAIFVAAGAESATASETDAVTANFSVSDTEAASATDAADASNGAQTYNVSIAEAGSASDQSSANVVSSASESGRYSRIRLRKIDEEKEELERLVEALKSLPSNTGNASPSYSVPVIYSEQFKRLLEDYELIKSEPDQPPEITRLLAEAQRQIAVKQRQIEDDDDSATLLLL